MRGAILLWAALLSVAYAQGQTAKLAERHARIQVLFKEEAHADVVREIERQFSEAVGTTWQDSLYGYVPLHGRSIWRLSNAQAAMDAAERLLQQARKADKDAGREVKTLIDLGDLYYDIGLPRESVRVDSLALRIAEQNQRTIPADLLSKANLALGTAYADIGDLSRALPLLEAALAELGRLKPPPSILLATIRMTMGGCLRRMGRTSDAERSYKTGLIAIAHDTSTEALSRRASLLGNTGILVQRTGDMHRCKTYYHQSLSALNTLIQRFANDPVRRDGATMNRSRIYLNMASVYASGGDVQRARELLDLCMKDRLSVLSAQHPQVIAVNDAYAELEAYAGDPDRAEQLIRAQLNSARAIYGERSADHASVGYKLARVLGKKEQYDRADSMYTAVMRQSAKASDPDTDPMLAQALLERGKMRIVQGRYNEAITDLIRAKAMVALIDGAGHDRTAELQIIISEAALLNGDTVQARLRSDTALGLITERLAQVQRPFAPVAQRNPYLVSDAIHVQVAIKRAAHPHDPDEHAWLDRMDLAIASLQRNKASLNDEASRLKLIGSQKKLFDLALDIAYDAYQRSGDTGDLQRFLDLSETDRSILLKSRLSTFSGLHFAGVPDPVLEREQQLLRDLEMDPVDRAGWTDLQAREQAYGAFLDTLNKDHPKYFALRYGEPLVSIEELRQRLVTPKRDLLAYAVTSEHLHMLVIRADTAALLRTSAKGLAAAVKAFNDAVVARDPEAYTRAAHGLYLLVFAPVAALLRQPELLIIPDGELHHVNFEALLVKPGSKEFRKNLLIQRHAIAYLLSATTAVQFADLARERANGVLAVAPGFTDELKQDYVAGMHDPAMVDRDFLNYVRQPFAVSTAQALGGSMKAHVMVGAEASERGFRASADQYGILHLGTHAEMNATSPMYSRLVLSKDSSRSAEGGVEADADGYLHAYEIYELDLRAQLAVLTACETGAGKNDEGEGVRSLGYSFAYAGCPSLVMSLWNIDEKVSSEIIARFYEHLADGMPKHIALQQAKLDHINNAPDELALPYYWAGLVLVGDVEPVEVGSSLWRHAPWVLASLLIVVVILWSLRRRSARG